MTRFQNKYRIESSRLQNWDYSRNASYFVTICTFLHKCYFGRIESGIMILSGLGLQAEKLWQEIPQHFPFVELSDFVVMPNHVHGIIIINKSVETQNLASLQRTTDKPVETQNFASLPPQNITSAAMPHDDMYVETQDFASLQRPIMPPPNTPKSGSSKNHFGPQSRNLASIIRGYKTGVTKISRDIIPGFEWQPRYHDHIIRNDRSFERIRDYIRNNPQNWKEDSLYE